jgi:polar amino acid transport system substrate-binding protein
MISDALRADLAPNGRLRAGVNHANTVIATKDAVTGELRGVSVDLVRELARRLEVPLELTGYDYSGGIVQALLDSTIDVGGIAGGAGSGREDALDFTAGYLQLQVTFMVRAESAIHHVKDVDRPGVRVGITAGSAFAPALSRAFTRATLVTGPGRPTAIGLLESGQVDVLAGLRHQLLDARETLPGSRVLEATFLTVEQRLAILKGKPAGLAYLYAFVEEAKASGFVASALATSGNANVPVSPTSPT